MASSQVEMSSAFDRESCFSQQHTNLNKLVNDQSRRIDLWVHRRDQWQECDNIGNISIKHHKLDNKWARAREMVLSVDHSPAQEYGGGGGGGTSPKKQPPVEVSNLVGGVSSLVQKWKGFEAERSTNNNNNNAVGEEDGGPFAFGDTESDHDRTTTTTTTIGTGPPSSCSRDSDATEIERLRVADIIRKLTDVNNSDVCDSPSPRHVIRTTLLSSNQSAEAATVMNSPRIRGRQAFNDLLLQMERDRHKEIEGLAARKAVSKFSHRGRIQAVLRFRFLRRGMEAEEEGRYHSNVKSSQMPKAIQSSSFLNIRERVNSKSSIASERCHKETNNNNHHHHHNLATIINSGDNNTKPAPDIEIIPHNEEKEKQEVEEEEEDDTDHHVIKSNNDHTPSDCCEVEPPSYYHKEEPTCSNQHSIDNNNMYYWVTDHVSDPEVNGWRKQMQYVNHRQLQGNNREWIDEISRPRSDWEGLRQARYQEMLDPFLDNNEEIRVLLGRRSVSTFLSSGLREQIDRLMVSHVRGQQQTLKNKKTQEERHHRSPKQVALLDKQADEQDDDYSDNFDEYEEDECLVGEQYSNQFDDYTDIITSSPPESWPQNQDRESSEYSYHIASPSTQQSSSNYCSHESRQNFSTSQESAYGKIHSTIDIKLTYDLRAQMEKLHQEMSELRKSIKCCMDMQIKLQRSINKENTTTDLQYSEAKCGRRNAVKKATIGGRCCICCKIQVDSLLYRCGHMCTCFKCAHKLQWSSGKCPICRAPILDVVRTCTNHS
ncbi:hypothetical protein OROHE_024857 [Orobanche hederae]